MLQADLNQHISITSSREINLICKPLLAKTPITVIDYSRVYLDGSRLELSNHTSRIESAILSCSKAMQHIYTPALIPPSQRYLLVDPWLQTIEGVAAKILKSRKLVQQELFNIGNELRIITRTNGYTEMFHFYSDSNQKGIENFYLNNINLLEQFILYFLNYTQGFIQQADKQRIIRPWRKPNSNIIILDGAYSSLIEESNKIVGYPLTIMDTCPKKFYFTINNINLYITRREIDCIVEVINGKTNKEIASKLFLSIRTVEKHIESLFVKSNCSNRKELASFFLRKGILATLALS